MNNLRLSKFNKMHAALSITAVIYVAASVVAINSYNKALDNSRADAIKQSIEKAAVQCYALEGHYPPSITYLEENYGISLDRDKYHYDYFAFASNIRPSVVVIEK